MVDCQKQHDILVHFLDGTTDNCIRTGNNAAWRCQRPCHQTLIGYSDELNSPRDYSRVICPRCERVFRIVAPGFRRVPTHVQEIGGQVLALSTQNRKSLPEIEQIPALVRDLYNTIGELNKLFKDRPFTLDGHLVGSIGEVIAAHKYNLHLLPPSTEGYDALTVDNKRVEIKITQGKSVALRNQPDHLLVLKLHKDGATEEVYYGPGVEPWNQSGRRQKNGQRPISLRKLKDLMKSVSK